MTRILLIRHGETDMMRTHISGRLPGIPLNAAGHRQAEAVAARLTRPDALITSPIQRTVETAQAIARCCGLEPELLDDFLEFDFGDWAGKTFDEIRSDPRWNDFNERREIVSAPGGETMRQVQERALSGLDRVVKSSKPGSTFAVVSHGDVIRALILHAAGTPIRSYWRFRVDPASISELALEDGAWTILRVNDTAHLEHLSP